MRIALLHTHVIEDLSRFSPERVYRGLEDVYRAVMGRNRDMG